MTANERLNEFFERVDGLPLLGELEKRLRERRPASRGRADGVSAGADRGPDGAPGCGCLRSLSRTTRARRTAPWRT